MEADQGGGNKAGVDGQAGGGAGAQGARRGEGGGPRGAPGPSGPGRGHPLHGCGGAVTVREKGQRGGRGGWAAEGEAAPGGGAGSRRSRGGARHASSSPEPTATHWGSESPPPPQYAPQPVQRGPRTAKGWRAGDVAKLVCYVKWAGRTRGGRKKRGTHPFSDLVGRAGRPRGGGPVMEEGRWRRVLGEALPELSLDCPRDGGKSPGC